MAGSLFSGALAGLLGFLGFGGPADRLPTEPRPVSAPVVASAASGIRGTIVLVHGGAWRGPDSEHQQRLVRQPGELLVQRGWRVVSVDYKKGQEGLQDVLDTIGQELTQPNGKLLFVYGESAGAQLALVAAARLPAVDCVIGAGAPTDFQAYLADPASKVDKARKFVAQTLREVFGETPQATAPWEPVHLAGAMEADVMLLRQADDALIPLDQVERFRAVRPATQSAELEAGDPNQPDQAWLHGTISANGLRSYQAAIGSFVDRVAAAHQAGRRAGRTRCAGANRRVARIGTAHFRRALRCLARRSSGASRVARSRASRLTPTTTAVLGEVTPARAWAALRATRPGRRQLAALGAGKARASLQIGNPSQLLVNPAGTVRKRAKRR